jgi:hypothetical protein
VCAVLLFAPSALADDDWLPHPAGATWTYQWSDTAYSPAPTTENVSVDSQSGTNFKLAWRVDGEESTCDSNDATITGTVSFNDADNGIVPTDWCSNAPPPAIPILCAQATSCGNSIASTYYTVIWGALNTPVLAEPLEQGLTWDSSGGTAGDVTAVSTYLGQQKVTVPAFSAPVLAAEVRTQITQAGALGDPYGSGTRTTWWVYGVGPVKTVFDHSGSPGAVTTAVLQSTNQTAQTPPTDLDYFPLAKGLSRTYRWTNTKHLTKPETEKFTIDAILNDTVRFTVANVSGPIKVQGDYVFSKRLDGVTNLAGETSSATLLKFPPLGPRGSPASSRNHFVTPFDLMNFGIGTIMPAYPAAGDHWSETGHDYTTFGVKGTSTVIGIQDVTVPAGTFKALVIRSTLEQNGYPYGSGTRTSWFVAGKGLVKLVFDHDDHSVSTVVLVK